MAHRKASRRSNKRRGRNPRRNPVVRYFNAFGGGGIVGKVTGTAKRVVSTSNAKAAAAIVATIAAGFAVPAKWFPSQNVGWKGLAITGAATTIATVVVSFAAPALVPVMVVGALAAVLLKAGLTYVPKLFSPDPTPLAGFLTLRNPVGQIPANVLAPGQLAGFLEARQPYAAVGPTSALTAMGGGERFSSVN